MKTFHKVKSKRLFLRLSDERWLQKAVQELDRQAISPDKRLAYEMLIAQNAAAVYTEQKKISDMKTVIVTNLLSLGVLTIEQIAQSVEEPVAFVLVIQEKIG